MVLQELLPVLVFIHGGSWQAGSAKDTSYSPIYLMDQDIVVVAIQYRIGALGFLRYGMVRHKFNLAIIKLQGIYLISRHIQKLAPRCPGKKCSAKWGSEGQTSE